MISHFGGMGHPATSLSRYIELFIDGPLSKNGAFDAVDQCPRGSNFERRVGKYSATVG
jgi:hypothetical protein